MVWSAILFICCKLAFQGGLLRRNMGQSHLACQLNHNSILWLLFLIGVVLGILVPIHDADDFIVPAYQGQNANNKCSYKRYGNP